MQKWEYTWFIGNTSGYPARNAEELLAKLTELGENGWELVAVIQDQTFYFKRPKA